MFTVDFSKLNTVLESIWADINENNDFMKIADSEEITSELYALYLIETYFYTSHNAKNQAIVATRPTDIPHAYQSYCFKHAWEESGHERMASSDLKNMGYDIDLLSEMKPLPSTEVLVSYLYRISETGNPYQRLGYSYWAENCYHYIDPTLKNIKAVLGLSDNEMSFFIAHSSIDEDHFDDVVRMIERVCTSDQDISAIERVMDTSLRLTSNILTDVYRHYIALKQKSKKGDPLRLKFLETRRNA